MTAAFRNREEYVKTRTACLHASRGTPALRRSKTPRFARQPRPGLCTETHCLHFWERGRLARCPRVAGHAFSSEFLKRASRLEFDRRDQASSGRAARAPRTRDL